jgi:hypothetical protein
MSISQALQTAASARSYALPLQGAANPSSSSVGNKSTTAAVRSSDAVQISAQAVNLYQANIGAAATPTYNVAQALGLALSAGAGSLAISDTAANISKGFTALAAMNAKIGTIKQTDTAAIALSETQFVAGLTDTPANGLLAKINSGTYKVALSGVQASSISLNRINNSGSKVAAVAFADTSANIVTNIAAIASLGTKVSAIQQTSKSPLTLTYANTVSYASVLAKIDKGSYTLNLSDTASNIATNLAAITKLGTKVSTISQTNADTALTLNTASLSANLNTLKKINAGDFHVGLNDTAALITKSWTALTAIEKNINSLTLTDATPKLTLSAAQTLAGSALVDKVSNDSRTLTVADTATNLSTHLTRLLTLGDKITQVTQTGTGNIAVSKSQVMNTDLTAFLEAKMSNASYGLAVSGADNESIVEIVNNTHVKTVALTLDGGTLNPSDQEIKAALQSSKITNIAVTNATIANVNTLSADKRVKSISISDTKANFTNAANLVTLDALMKKTKGIISKIDLVADTRELVSVSQATYTQYAATVFSAPKNFALEVDLGTPAGIETGDLTNIRTALKTTANSSGSFGVQVWDFTKGVYKKAITLNAGVNFVKLGTTSTFLDTGDAKLNAVLNVGSFQWQQNPNQATVSSSDYALKPGVFALGNTSAKPTITYKFITSDQDTNLSATDKKGFLLMNDNQRQSVTQALNYISSLVNINFQLVTNPGPDVNTDINFGTNNQGTTSGGYATGANPAIRPVNLLLNNQTSVNTNPQVGDYGWETLIHEIGHTLGLKHPGSYNAGGGVTPGPYLPSNDDTKRNTVMSYKSPSDAAINWVAKGGNSYGNSGVSPRTFMPLDILALQFLYGKNSSGTSFSDNTKGLSNFQTTTFTNDWLGMQTLSSGTQGLDLDLSAVSASNIVDLRAGAFSSINIKAANYNAGIGGTKAQTFYNFNNVGLAYDASIKKLIGGKASNVVYVGNTNVEIDGTEGTDKVYLDGSASDWRKTETENENGTEYIYQNKKSGLTATLRNVESIAYYASTTSPTLHTRVDLTA